MRHSNFQAKDSSFEVINKVDTAITVYKFTLTDGLSVEDSPAISATGDYYKVLITTPAVDCFLFIEWGSVLETVRVGDPDILVIGNALADNVYDYDQVDFSGSVIDTGTMTEIGNGYYYIEPSSLVKSVFIIGDTMTTLSVPYKVVNCSDSGSGVISSSALFSNVGYNMFGFLGERYSYFDLPTGKWVNDDTVEAKASDLAKAVCHKYGLVWDDTANDQWIGNYIKYIRSYTENDGLVRYYKPYKTPDNNAANFSLMQDDEAGNLVVRGVSMLLLQSLDTVNGTDGATVPFREVTA